MTSVNKTRIEKAQKIFWDEIKGEYKHLQSVDSKLAEFVSLDGDIDEDVVYEYEQAIKKLLAKNKDDYEELGMIQQAVDKVFSELIDTPDQ
jgi:hypothetical protein